ncbi:hypothetical protein GMRT_11459 [Giardia muris]|uniref:Uncharacterized protein n=1 Tax=Giardia muris TaxID=5742 RepID=A0A4Z1T6S2_GIAMU|nr:hypothetical protein GMRT_11459 [Giardia muris]|eukprot:TNJ29763.1 hypothetical protein GMRT_11459 [Giardia muris]
MNASVTLLSSICYLDYLKRSTARPIAEFVASEIARILAPGGPLRSACVKLHIYNPSELADWLRKVHMTTDRVPQALASLGDDFFNAACVIPFNYSDFCSSWHSLILLLNSSQSGVSARRIYLSIVSLVCLIDDSNGVIPGDWVGREALVTILRHLHAILLASPRKHAPLPLETRKLLMTVLLDLYTTDLMNRRFESIPASAFATVSPN